MQALVQTHSSVTGRGARLNPIVVATRANGAQLGNGFSDGVQTIETSRLRHHVTANCSQLRVQYGNFRGFDLIGLNDVTVKAAIEHGTGIITPVYFSGNRTVTLAPGEVAVSDPVDLTLGKGDVIYSRQAVSVASGNKYPKGWSVFTNSAEGSVAVGVDAVDAGTISSSPAYMFAPLGVLGVAQSGTPVIAIVGDSIAAGQGSSSSLNSFIIRALGGNYGQNFCHRTLAVNGDRLDLWNAATYRKPLVSGCSHAITELSINDIRNSASLATIQARLQACWQHLSGQGIRVYQTTITPDTSSTDSWATTENQTVRNAAQNTVRVALNDWIRTTPSPLTGYFEIADIMETARNSGIWKASRTGDGLHPNETGHAEMSAGIDTAVFA